jgi:hypothetical protein
MHQVGLSLNEYVEMHGEQNIKNFKAVVIWALIKNGILINIICN